MFFGLLANLRFFPVVPEAREVFKNLPDTRGVVFPEYEPVASHHDPIQVRNYTLSQDFIILSTSPTRHSPSFICTRSRHLQSPQIIGPI